MYAIRSYYGLNPRSFDKRGNYSMGVSEQIIFPEINYDEIRITSYNVCYTKLLRPSPSVVILKDEMINHPHSCDNQSHPC